MQFDQDAGEQLRQLLPGQASRAQSRIVDEISRLGAAALDGSQHDEVVEAPMENGRQCDFAQILGFAAQRSRVQLHLVGDLEQGRQRHPFHARSEADAQGQHVDLMPMIAGDHRQAGETAFRGLVLMHHRHTAAREAKSDVAHARDRTAWIGSNSQSRKLRRSSTISAWRVMPGSSGRSSPKARMRCRFRLTRSR